jgi:PAS domain S-box-containing protein
MAWSALAALLCFGSPLPLPLATRLLLTSIPVGLGLMLAWAFVRFGELNYERAVLSSTWICFMCVALVAYASGRGIHSHALGLLGLMLCAVTATLGLRATWPLLATSILMVLGLWVAQIAHWIPGLTDQTRPSTALLLLAHAMNLSCGLSVGVMAWFGLDIYRRRLRRREERLSVVLRVAADAYWEQDPNGRFTHWSTQAGAPEIFVEETLLGLTVEEMPGARLMGPEPAGSGDYPLPSRQVFKRVVEVRVNPSQVRVIRLSGECRLDDEGKNVGFWGIAQDITAEHDAAQELAISLSQQRRAQALLTEVFATSPDAIAVLELDTGQYSMVNQGFTRISGYPESEVLGRTPQEISLHQDAEDIWKLLKALARQPRVEEVVSRMQTKQGEFVLVSLSAARFHAEGQDYVVVNARDITESERLRVEHEAMLLSAPVGVVFTRRWHILHGNPAFEAMFRWAPGTAQGRHVSSVWGSQDAFERADLEATQRLLRGESVDFETQARRADGSLFWCRMAGRLVDPDGAIRSGIIWITEDVTERRAIEQALALSRDAAESANRAKSAFLANTSHELRTPLNALLGLAQLAKSERTDEASRQRYLTQIVESARGLAGIISDVLDLAKIEAGKVTIEYAPVALHGLLQDLEQAHGPLAQSKGLGISLRLSPDLPAWVMGDGLRLRQILANLLTNAIKFTAKGEVRLSAHLQDDALRLAVIDTGPGIEADAIDKLFKPFSQADASTTRRFGGTGLGLAICRELVSLMGGVIGVESQPGLGSTFWVRLPLELPQGAIGPADKTSHDATAGNTLMEGLLQGKRAMVVEDNEVNMLITSALLQQWGMTVLAAPNGQAAVDLLMQRPDEPLDLILMDLQMPGMGGIEATQAIHALPGRAGLPVVALTAAALVDEREAAFAAGMVAFLSKPIDADILYRSLVLIQGSMSARGASEGAT